VKGIQNADQLTRRHTAFESFESLIKAPDGYRPSIQSESAGACLLPCGIRITTRNRRQELRRLADLYDEAQRNRGDHRRAWRS